MIIYSENTVLETYTFYMNSSNTKKYSIYNLVHIYYEFVISYL